jgi:peptidoglycan/xylan/chitin deacetylase (PgdA/CDA1 family)
MPNAFPLIHPDAVRNGKSHPTTLLVWHDIIASEKERLVWFDTTVAQFEAQLEQLDKAGIRPISLTALHAYLTNGIPVPPAHAAILCFDDNTAGIYRHAAPLLKQRRWPFIVSAHSAYVGVPTSKSHNSYEELREMERMEATVVSQTHTHPPDLRTLTIANLRREMSDSKRRLESELGHPVNFLTYPSGKWDARVAAAAQTAGYVMALTEDFGPAESSPHLLGVKRYSTHRRFEEGLASIRRKG